MDCTRAEQLLPLRAGGDLDEDGRESARLAAHLEGCAACRRLTGEWAEWAETVSLLRLGDAPEFDAAFFDPIRRDVMREITATATTVSKSRARPAPAALSTLLAGLFRPRTLAYAAPLALLCAALFFAPRLARAPRPSKLAGVVVGPGVHKQSSFARGTPGRAPRDAVAHKDVRRKTGARGLPARKDGQAPRESAAAMKTTTPRAEDDAPSPPSPSIARAESPSPAPRPSAFNAAAPGVIPADVELAVVRDEREMTKIDLRTSDPDVRIIWFSPQPNAQTSPRSTNDKR